MRLLLTALFSSFFFILVAIALQIRHRKVRQRKLSTLELRPNCLLTRYPIVFLSGRKSLFRLFDHWNSIPFFLREHGYEVVVIEPAPRDPARSVIEILDELKTKGHFIFDSSQHDEIEELARYGHRKIASLTCVRRTGAQTSLRRSRTRKLTADQLRPLATAIEYFEFETSDLAFQFRSAVGAWVTETLLSAHNRLVFAGRDGIDPFETGEYTHLTDSFANEEKFLNLAVSLAERDLRQGDFA